MAGALVGKPKVLILDEPTVGLDPQQVKQIRDLIKSLRKDHTVLISSHILSEISQICEKVIIIDKGKILAVDTPENLEKKVNNQNILTITIEDEKNKINDIIKEIKDVKEIKLVTENSDGTKQYTIFVEQNKDIRKEVSEKFAKNEITILELKKTEATLEEAFLQLIDNYSKKEENNNYEKKGIMLAVLKKELKTYFLTPIGYVFIGLFLEISSLIFYLYTYASQSLNFSYTFYDSAIILTFIIAILTMNMFAGERKNGTDQLIMTSPKSITGIVLGKFFAALLVVIITEIFSLIYLAIISHFGTPNISTLGTTLLGFMLLTMAYISFGELASSITGQPIIAYIITFAFFFATMYIRNLSNIFSMISFIDLYEKFVTGIIPIEEIIQLLTFTITCIILTIIILQRRRNLK